MLKLVIYSLSIIHHSWQIVTKHIVSTECWICSIWWHITSVDTGFTGIQVLGYHCYLGNNKYIHILLQDIIHTLFISDWCSISPPLKKNNNKNTSHKRHTLHLYSNMAERRCWREKNLHFLNRNKKYDDKS